MRPKPASSGAGAVSSHELVAVAAPLRTAPLPSGYSRRKSFPVTSDLSGVDGSVELLEDERSQSNKLLKPLQPARVRLTAGDGRELYTLTMERPLASVELVHLRPRVPSYQVTVDLTAEFGSYSGPLTRFAEARNGKLEWLSAIDVQTGKSRDIAVASTLKTEWRLSPLANGDKQILQIACRPNFDAPETDAGMEFLVTLSRFTIEGGRWQLHTRIKRGCWESGDAFPATTEFP